MPRTHTPIRRSEAPASDVETRAATVRDAHMVGGHRHHSLAHTTHSTSVVAQVERPSQHMLRDAADLASVWTPTEAA